MNYNSTEHTHFLQYNVRDNVMLPLLNIDQKLMIDWCKLSSSKKATELDG